MKQKSIFLVLVLINTILAHGQSSKDERSDRAIFYSQTSFSTFDKKSKDLVGSVYINQNFSKARINDEKTYDVRYDAFHDEMEVKKGEKFFSLAKENNFVVNFIETDKMYRVYSNRSNKAKEKSFFRVLRKYNNISLLVKEKIKFYEEKRATGYKKYTPPTLKRVKDVYYIGLNDNSAIKLKSKKKFLNLFSKYKGDIKKYMKSERINLKKEKDLLKLFDFLNKME